MRILLEAHHPGDIHFWKYPVRELLEQGHRVHMVGRERDVMRQLLEAYDWIPHEIPKRPSQKNRFPLREMLSRQMAVARAIHRFRPDVVASLFGSYTQSAALFGCRNIIFTDSEFQHFNHRIAHPFATEILTPYCFYKPLGPKQTPYNGIHELAFLDGRRYQPDPGVAQQSGLAIREYIVIRLSSWNTFHDINHKGIGPQVIEFVKRFKDRWRIVISAEENQLPETLRPFAMRVHPARFHDLLAFARFVLTEGASTASEAACLGVPTVYVNSTEPRGYLQMLEERYGLVRNFQEATPGLETAVKWLDQLDKTLLDALQTARKRLFAEHIDVTDYVVKTLTGMKVP
jgi:hypothetical protein